MDFEETTINETDGLSEVVETPEEVPSESLDSVLEEGEPQPEQTEAPKAKEEPGYVRGRIDKAVQKVRAEYDQQIANLKASFEEQMRPIREQLFESQAQELVKSRKVADIETARELVRLRNGQPVQVEEPQQPRQANGQFAPKEKADPETSTRINMLQHQADRIKANNGPDVIAEFKNNEEIKAKVISGEMDFYDVAEYIRDNQKRRPPTPMRSSNGASGMSPNAIANMTDEQFARMEKRIKEGARYELR